MSVHKIEQPDPTVGVRLRTLRERYGLSQRELARRASLTNATISQVEQGVVSPTVASLRKITGGLGMTLAEFFTVDLAPDAPIFFGADELHELGSADISLRLVAAADKQRSLQMLHETYAPGADTGPEAIQHPGEESGVVVRGHITVTVGGQTRVLGPGDAYHFSSLLPHRFSNHGDEPVELVSASTPPSF